MRLGASCVGIYAYFNDRPAATYIVFGSVTIMTPTSKENMPLEII